MNLLFSDIKLQSNGSWLFTWDYTDSVAGYRIVLFGDQLLDKITIGRYLYRQTSNFFRDYPPPLELVVQDGFALSELYYPYIQVQWYNGNVPNAQVSYYQLQQKSPETDNAWIDGEQIIEDGSFLYSHKSPLMIDGETFWFRVISVGEFGEQSPNLPLKVPVVCCPFLVETALDIDYDDGSQSITVSEVVV